MREGLIIKSFKNRRVKALFADMQFFYIIYDALCGSNKSAALTACYVNRQLRGTVEISQDVHVSDRTLDRYREEFVDCFYHIMKVRGPVEEIAAAWDK